MARRGSAAARRLRRATSGLALVALLGAGGLPTLEAVLAPQDAPFCGRGGRCCCAGRVERADERPCLRRGCGCEEQPDATAAPGILRLEAVLPAASLPPRCGPGALADRSPLGRPLRRPHAPPVPPPKRPLSA